MMLDVTAGNRRIWHHLKYKPKNTVFLDKETELLIPPDVLGAWANLPFRTDVFDCIIFDPPHSRFGKTSLHNNPQHRSFWASFKSKRHLVIDIIKAQKEFARVSQRLCFKWNETTIPLWNLLPLFRDWVAINKKLHKSKLQRGKSRTWWVTFIAL